MYWRYMYITDLYAYLFHAHDDRVLVLIVREYCTYIPLVLASVPVLAGSLKPRLFFLID